MQPGTDPGCPFFMRVRFTVPFLLLTAGLFLLDERGFFLLVWSAVFLHEAGHLLAIRLLHCRMELAEFRLTGLNLRYTPGRMGYWQDLVIAAAGPGANLLCAGALALAGKRWPQPEPYAAVGVHILLACFNLLPALPMDGGRILSALLQMRWGPETGERLLSWTTAIVAAGLFCAGLYAIRPPWHNPTLLLTSTVLFAGLFKENALQNRLKTI